MADDTTKEKIIIDVQTNADEAAKDVNKLSASITKTTDSAKDLDKTFDEVYEGMKPLTARMGEAEDRLYELALAGKTASDEYQGLLAKVAEYKKTQQETDRVVDAAATTMAQKLGGASQLAATAVQGATASMALFGDQSEDTEKLLLKVQSAMAFADAISSISEMGGQWRVLKAAVLENSIVTKANAAATGLAAMAQKLFTGSVNTSTTSFKVLKGAIAGLGIGLLITGLIYVVNNFDKLKKTVENVIPGLSKVADFIGDVVNAVTDFIGVTSDADRAIDRMKANADKSLALNKKFLDEHGSQLDEYTKQKLAAVDDYHNLLKEDGANQVALNQELSRKLAKIDKDRQDEIDKNREEAAKKAKDAQDKINAAAKAKQDKIDADAKAKRDKEAAELEAAKEAARKATEALLSEVNKSIDEATEKGIEGSLSAQEVEIRNIKDAYFQKIELAKQFGKDTVALEDAQANEINEVNLKYQKERYDVEEEARQKRLNAEKEALEQKRAIQNAEFDLATQSIALVKDLFGKNKAVQKAAIIADGAVALGKIAVNTVTQVSEDNKASPLTFGLPWSGIHLAGGIVGAASVVSSTSKALQALGGGSAPSAPSLPGASGGVNASPQTGFQASSENQIATSINGANKTLPPIKTYVVSSDVTTAQGLDAALVSDNSFGGKVGG